MLALPRMKVELNSYLLTWPERIWHDYSGGERLQPISPSVERETVCELMMALAVQLDAAAAGVIVVRRVWAIVAVSWDAEAAALAVAVVCHQSQNHQNQHQ